jgi:hypothetical protein
MQYTQLPTGFLVIKKLKKGKAIHVTGLGGP